MDNGKILSILAIVVSIGTALIAPLAGIKPVYGIVVGLIAAVAGAIGKSIMESTNNGWLTVIGIGVAVTAAIVNYADIQTILSPGTLATITHIGAILAALGKGIMGTGKPSTA